MDIVAALKTGKGFKLPEWDKTRWINPTDSNVAVRMADAGRTDWVTAEKVVTISFADLKAAWPVTSPPNDLIVLAKNLGLPV